MLLKESSIVLIFWFLIQTAIIFLIFNKNTIYINYSLVFYIALILSIILSLELNARLFMNETVHLNAEYNITKRNLIETNACAYFFSELEIMIFPIMVSLFYITPIITLLSEKNSILFYFHLVLNGLFLLYFISRTLFSMFVWKSSFNDNEELQAMQLQHQLKQTIKSKKTSYKNRI